MADRNRSTPAFTPTTWTKTVGTTVHERVATSVSDEVQFRFDGWRPKGKSAGDADKNAAAAAGAKPHQTTGAKNTPAPE